MEFLTKYSLFLAYFLLKMLNQVGSIEFQHRIYGKRGEISSPNYPKHYPLNTTVTWYIAVETFNTIQVNFTNFNLEKNKKCIYDYVFIEEMLAGGGSITRKYCGHKLPPSFTSVSNKIKLVFVSDALSNVELGFKARWKEVTGSTLDHVLRPSKPTKSGCFTKTITLSTPCSKIQPTPGTQIKPTKCSCSKSTKTVTKTVMKFVPVSKSSTKTISSTPAIKNDVEKRKEDKSTQGNKIENRIEDVKKCEDPSSTHSLTDAKQVEEKDRSRNLVVSLGVVLIALFITNIFLLVLLCKRERGYNAISFNSLRKYLGRARPEQNTPDIFFSSYNRPTLRMMNGEIVVVPPPDPSTPESEHMTVLLEEFEANKQTTQPAVEEQLPELPFQLIRQQQDTLTSGTEETTLASTRTEVVSENGTETL